MAKTLILNKLGNRKFSIYVPASDVDASSFAENFLDGISEICQLQSEIGDELEPKVYDVLVRFRDNTNEMVSFLGFYAKSSKSDNDLINALVGKTIDGVKGDTITILKMQSVISQDTQDNNQGG